MADALLASDNAQADMLIADGIRSGKLDLSGGSTPSPVVSITLKRVPFGVSELILRRRGIEVLPKIDGTARFNSADFSDNYLRDVDVKSSVFTSLSVLNVSRNHIVEFPVGVLDVSMLRSLDLSHNFLVTIPDSISALRLLTTLNARSNRITVIPQCLWTLSNLETVDLSQNLLTHLHPSVADAPMLKKLNLARNPIGSVPAELIERREMEELDLTGTPAHALYMRVSSTSSPLPQQLTASPRLSALRSSMASLAPLSPTGSSTPQRPPSNDGTSPARVRELRSGSAYSSPYSSAGSLVATPKSPKVGPIIVASEDITALKAEIGTLRHELDSVQASNSLDWQIERAGLAARLVNEQTLRQAAEDHNQSLLTKVSVLSDSPTRSPLSAIFTDAQKESLERRLQAEKRARETAEAQLKDALRVIRESGEAQSVGRVNSGYWLSFERESRRQLKQLNDRLVQDCEAEKEARWQAVQKCEELERMLQAKSQELISVRVDCTLRIDNEREMRERAERALFSAEEKVSSLSIQISTLETDIRSLRNANSEQHDTLTRISQEFDLRSSRLQSSKDSTEAQLNAAEVKIRDLTYSLDKASTLASTMTDHAVRAEQSEKAAQETFRKRFEEMDSILSQTKTDYETVRGELRRKEEALAQMHERYTSQVVELQSVIESLRVSLDKERESNRLAESSLQAMNLDLSHRTSQLLQVQTREELQRTDSQEKITAAKSTTQQFERRVHDLSTRLVLVEQEREAAVTALRQVQQEALHLREQRDRAETELRARTSHLQSAYETAEHARQVEEVRAQRAETAVDVLQREIFRKELGLQEKAIATVMKDQRSQSPLNRPGVVVKKSPLVSRSPSAIGR